MDSQSSKTQEEAVYLLRRGHNICVVGEGSKIDILKEVAGQVGGVLVVRVDGFDEEYRFKRLLKTMLDTVLSYSTGSMVKSVPKVHTTPDTMLGTLQTLLSVDNSHFDRILLMVNNLDGR